MGNYLLAIALGGETRIKRLENLLYLNAKAHLLFGEGLLSLNRLGTHWYPSIIQKTSDGDIMSYLVGFLVTNHDKLL